MRLASTPRYANSAQAVVEVSALRAWFQALMAPKSYSAAVGRRAVDPAGTASRVSAMQAMACVAEQGSPVGG